MQPLTKYEKNIIEYFWNPYLKKRRLFISKEMITYLDNEKYENEAVMMKNAVAIEKHLLSLEQKQYIKVYKTTEKDTYYEIAENGVLYFHFKYHKIKIKLQTLIETTPLIITILVSTIGLISSIFGIIQFIDWWLNK